MRPYKTLMILPCQMLAFEAKGEETQTKPKELGEDLMSTVAVPNDRY